MAELVECGLKPRLLPYLLAAAYVDLSPNMFLRGVVAGDWPKPIEHGDRKHWDRLALDAVIDQRSGLKAPQPGQAG